VKDRFEETYFSREQRYSLGIDLKNDGRFASFPVTNGVVDYEEQYVITPVQYELFMTDEVAAIEFINECRRREHDDLLIYRPGTNRGIPS
jgi:hypothetical protein